jgi:hypothetical protein
MFLQISPNQNKVVFRLIQALAAQAITPVSKDSATLTAIPQISRHILTP